MFAEDIFKNNEVTLVLDNRKTWSWGELKNIPQQIWIEFSSLLDVYRSVLIVFYFWKKEHESYMLFVNMTAWSGSTIIFNTISS